MDCLGSSGTGRFRILTGAVLSDKLDTELQELANAAAALTRAPMGLVTLVLRRTQYFRAHRGLPADLAAARATDRDVSFCQLVVRDGEMLEVEDAALDDRVPQDLVKRYGIRAYLGAPVELSGFVVGSLCVLDLVPRTFSPEEREGVALLAGKVSRRLVELAELESRTSQSFLGRAAEPAFAELRNLLTVIESNAVVGVIAASDLAPLVRLGGASITDAERLRVLGSIPGAAWAVSDLHDMLHDIREAAASASTAITALRGAMSRSVAPVTLATAVRLGQVVAHHHTKLIGGVRVPDVIPAAALKAPSSTAIALIASALSALASRMVDARLSGGIDLEFQSDPQAEELLLGSAGLGASTGAELAADLLPPTFDSTSITARGEGPRLCLRFVRQ